MASFVFILFFAAFAAALFFFTRLLWRRAMYRGPQGSEEEEEPYLERRAVLVSITTDCLRGRFTGAAGQAFFGAQFATGDGEVLSLSLPEAVYPQMQSRVGQRDILVTRYGRFVDFAGTLGQTLPDDPAEG